MLFGMTIRIAHGEDILEDSGAQIAYLDGNQYWKTTNNYLMNGIFWSRTCTHNMYDDYGVDIPMLYLTDFGNDRPSNDYYTIAIDMQ